MRVALLHSAYSGSAPSGENVAVGLQAEALRAAGYDVTQVGVSTDQLSAHPLYPVRTAVGVATGRGWDPTERLRAARPDIVHIHNLFPNISTRWLGHWEGPIVATIHNYRPLCAAGTLARDGAQCVECVGRRIPMPALRHRCYRSSLLATAPLAVANVGGVNAHPVLRRADRIIFLAPRARGIYADAGYSHLDRSVVLPNFVEPNEGASGAADPGDAPWLYFGRLAPEKGVVPMLRAWPQEVPLLVYGAGPDEEQVARLCRGAVEYRGPLPREALLARIPWHAGFVFPSLFAEGLPTVYLESLAAGVPVVAHSGNSAADDIAEHGSGRVFDRFEELPRLVSAVGDDHDRYRDAASRRYWEGFSQQAWVDGIGEVYRAAQVERASRRSP